MDEPIEKLAGIFYAYRRLMYDLGLEVREFDISDPRHFRELHMLCIEGRPGHLLPQIDKVQDRNGEFYELFEVYGLKIRCHLPDERRRQELERERDKAKYEAMLRSDQMMMQPIPPMILTQTDIDRLNRAGLAPTPDGKIVRKKT